MHGSKHPPASSEGKDLTPSQVAAFQQTIRDYFREHGRKLPWRETYDPYAILVSEIMLQQTQVERVREKYREFLAALPTLEALARAELAQVLSLWQGLGYNRRAVSLRACAQVVVELFGGNLPREVRELETLPGIGHYTARAVAAFAFGAPTTFIETNIRSVFIHHFFEDCDAVRDSGIMPLVEITLDRENPRDWYYALMDYGAMLKKSGMNPSRKSAHHSRQSPFRGSNREQRGQILRLILASPGVSHTSIIEELAVEAQQVSWNLQKLEQEGFIRQESDRFWVRG